MHYLNTMGNNEVMTKSHYRFDWYTLQKHKLLFLLLLGCTTYMTSCTISSKKHADAFEKVSIGDTRELVASLFGTPSHVEQPDERFVRYTSYGCQKPCVERLWFENRFLPSIEAWSVELDKDNRVIDKAYWVLP